MPEHVAHFFQRPAQGTRWLAQHLCYGYKHTLIAKGGCESASFKVRCTPAEAERIFSEYVGSVCQIFVDNPAEPIFEGYVDTVVLTVGSVVIQRSVENMGNNVNVTYYNADSPSTNKTEQTTSIGNADSERMYGAKTLAMDAGIHFNNTDKTHKTLLRNTILSVRSYPQISVSNSGSISETLVEVQLKGLQYYVWDWQVYNNTATSVFTASGVFTDVTVEEGSFPPTNASGVYVVSSGADSPGYSQIVTNTSFNISYKGSSGQTYLQFIQSIVEAGDGTQQWVFGITMPTLTDPYRYVYYRPATTAVAYTVRALRDAGRVRDLYGSYVPGWAVKPDRGIQMMDVLTGWNQTGDDPRTGYIESIDYDGDSGLVTWTTGDNPTLEGVMQQDRYFKHHRMRFGANTRQTV